MKLRVAKVRALKLRVEEVRALKLRGGEVCTLKLRMMKVRALKLRADEVCALKLPAGEVRSLKLRIVETCPLKLRADEVCALKLRIVEVRTLKFSRCETSTRHARVGKTGAAEVRGREGTARQIAAAKVPGSLALRRCLASCRRSLLDFFKLLVVDDIDAGQFQAIEILRNPSVALNSKDWIPRKQINVWLAWKRHQSKGNPRTICKPPLEQRGTAGVAIPVSVDPSRTGLEAALRPIHRRAIEACPS